MSAATILTLANGKGIDLTDPDPDIDFTVLAEHLAKVKRFNGATPGIEYSVAQHSVMGADAAFTDTGSIELAGYFLLHDGHEAFLGDDTTPKKRAIAEIAYRNFGILSAEIMASFRVLEDQFDERIHRAAGLAWPMPDTMKAAVKSYDLVMFVTEWRDLMRGTKHPNWDEYRSISPLRDSIGAWSWQISAGAFVDRCKRYLPVVREGWSV